MLMESPGRRLQRQRMRQMPGQTGVGPGGPGQPNTPQPGFLERAFNFGSDASNDGLISAIMDATKSSPVAAGPSQEMAPGGPMARAMFDPKAGASDMKGIEQLLGGGGGALSVLAKAFGFGG